MSVVVVVTGPVQIGQPAQVERTTGGRVPPTQHWETLSFTLRTPGQSTSAATRAEKRRIETVPTVAMVYMMEYGKKDDLCECV